MNIIPINGHVLVKPREVPDKTAGGIHLPDNARELPGEGTVVAVADDATEELTVGDHVIYKETAGTEITVEGEDYLLLAIDDLLVKYMAADVIPE